MKVFEIGGTTYVEIDNIRLIFHDGKFMGWYDSMLNEVLD